MKRNMKRLSFIGTGVLTVGSLVGSVLAVGPSKSDMDFCNQKAAQVSKASPVQPGASAKDSATAPKDSTGGPVAPGTAARPGPGSPQPGTNPTGGRITDSTQPGTPPSQQGMAPVGESDPGYRQAYLACLNERQK